MVNKEEFSKRLQLIFDYYDLTASAFADKIDVGKATISHLLSGRNNPSLDFVLRVVKNFPDVELYWLLNGKGTFPKSSSIPPEKKAENSNTSTPVSTSDKKPHLAEPASDTTTESIIKDTSFSGDVERIVIFFKNGTFKSYKAE